MKTSIARSFLMFTALVVFTTLKANPPADPLRAEVRTSLERTLKQQIDRFVTYPLLERTRNMDGHVDVSFVINAEGRVEVISARGTSEELRAYVLRKLSKVDIGSNPNGTWRTEHMRFVFHPEA